MRKNDKLYSSRGSVALNIVLIFALVIIAFIIYRLSVISRADTPEISVHGIENVARVNTQTPRDSASGFSDGLNNPASSTNFTPDEFGAGITNVSVFERDLNDDGRDDRITRTHVATETAHDYDQYKIELNRGNGEFVDVTPPDFRTVQGADCALAKLKFEFAPVFRVIKIERPWRETWTTPTTATRTIYALSNNEMMTVGKSNPGTVCDVTQLF